jgi:hypothetical protein
MLDSVICHSHWVGLSPLGTKAIVWLVVPAPDDIWWWWWWLFSNRWNANWQGKLKYSEKTCPRAILSTANPTWPYLGSNPDLRGGKPATNHLSYGTAKPIICFPIFKADGSSPHFTSHGCRRVGYFHCFSPTLKHPPSVLTKRVPWS